MRILAGLILVFSVTNSLGEDPFWVSPVSLASETCPADLSSLHQIMEAALASVSSPGFKKAILASLSASIPEAIQRADGLNAQIAYLQSEIVEQQRIQRYSEEVARETTGNFMEPLKPCPPHKKDSYCHAVEQYYISVALNLANRAFLDALLCYKRQGMR